GGGGDDVARAEQAAATALQDGIRVDDQPRASVECGAPIVAPLSPRIVVCVLEEDTGPGMPPADRTDAGPVVGEQEVDDGVRGAAPAPVEMVARQGVDGVMMTTFPLPPQSLREHDR